MKVRLYKGPFSGRVYDLAEAGRFEITIRDYKRMSKKEQWKAQRKYWQESYGIGTGAVFGAQWRPPLIEARYRLCTGRPVILNSAPSAYGQGQSVPINQTIMQHPDGSLFYEWTGEKKEFK